MLSLRPQRAGYCRAVKPSLCLDVLSREVTPARAPDVQFALIEAWTLPAASFESQGARAGPSSASMVMEIFARPSFMAVIRAGGGQDDPQRPVATRGDPYHHGTPGEMSDDDSAARGTSRVERTSWTGDLWRSRRSRENFRAHSSAEL